MLVLAGPVLCEQVLGFLVGLYDTWLSGRIEGISEVATGAVGLAAYVGWLASMLFGLVATGTTALVARHRGAGRAGGGQPDHEPVAGTGGVWLEVRVYALIYARGTLDGAVAGDGRRGGPDRGALPAESTEWDTWPPGSHWRRPRRLRGSGNMRTPMKVLGLGQRSQRHRLHRAGVRCSGRCRVGPGELSRGESTGSWPAPWWLEVAAGAC